jgi:hypothetical protein
LTTWIEIVAFTVVDTPIIGALNPGTAARRAPILALMKLAIGAVEVPIEPVLPRLIRRVCGGLSFNGCCNGEVDV